MKEYRQLTDEDRIEIYAMKQTGKQQKQIANAKTHMDEYPDASLISISQSHAANSRQWYTDKTIQAIIWYWHMSH